LGKGYDPLSNVSSLLISTTMRVSGSLHVLAPPSKKSVADLVRISQRAGVAPGRKLA